MTPAARLAAAIGVLDAWAGGNPVERALTGWARGARYAGSKDRAAVRDHVYDVLRRKGSCAALGGGESGRALVLGLLRLQGLDPDEYFTGEGHAPAGLADAERDLGAEGLTAWSDIPDWLHDPLRDSLDEQAERVIAAMQERAPLYLRINARRSAGELEEWLASDGIVTRKTILPHALEVVEGARRLRQSQAYLDGLVEIQDLSPQLACAAVDWPRSGRVLDYCAGGGGKALAIAAVSEAQVFVHDANPRRMADIPARADRAGVRLTALERPEAQAPYAAVLCDVPCSGSGTWRRDPEAKWLLSREKLTNLEQVQAEILDAAATLVAPGGQLVYMTCSLLDAENGGQLRAFQARHGWQVKTERRFLPGEASDGFFLGVLTAPSKG